MKTRLILPLATILMMAAERGSAQNIGINVNGAAPDASALLDIDATALPAANKKGLLVPRVALTATNLAAPVVAPAPSLLVYNTNTAGVVPTNVTPGYYYWDGGAWVRFATTGQLGWGLTGNAGTVAATNFLGTTDNVDFVVRTNNIERWRTLGATGRIGWGTTAPIAPLEVNSGAALDAIYGHSTNVGGWLGRETNITFGIPVQTVLGAGVYANNPSAGYTSAYTQSTGAATVAANINYSDVWIAQYNYVQNGTATGAPPGTYSQVNVTNPALAAASRGVWSFSGRGTTAGNPGFTEGVTGFAIAQNQDCDGVVGVSQSNSVLENAGGYFEADTYGPAPPPAVAAYAWVGGVIGGIQRKIVGIGSVAEIVPTPNHGRVTLTCPEAPEYWYQDYGTVQMVNGFAHVDLDPILADIIVVDANNPIRVFCTPVDMTQFNGVAIVNRTATGFDVVELNGGTHSGTIDYQLVVKPKTNFGEGRFPQAPGPHGLKPWMEPAAAKAANQPDPAKIYRWPSDHQTYGYDPDKVTPIGGMVRGGKNHGKFKISEGVFVDHLPAEKAR